VRFIIVGAGIVGRSLAAELVGADAEIAVAVLEQHHGTPRGSTHYATRFIGIHNDVAVLSELVQPARIYRRYPVALTTVDNSRSPPRRG